MSAHRWEELTRDEIAALAPRSVCVLPVAAIEQHGPQLATVTDTALVGAVLDRACRVIPAGVEVLIAPVQCFGASDNHLAFGGTLSLTSGTLRALLGDLVRSAARAGCRRVLIVNGHGGNAATCTTVAGDLSREEGILVATCSYWELAEPAAGSGNAVWHAGELETSLMLAVRPELVHLDRARPSPAGVPDRPRGLNVWPPDLWERIDGFTDDPRKATVELGEAMMARWSEALAAAIAEVAAA
jgi:creatinine amidohydrolase